MQRHENESFAAYKQRRADENFKTSRINHKTKGGSISSREKQRDAAKSAGTRLGGYGENLRSAMNRNIPVEPSRRRANERAFAKRIASSAPQIQPVSARQQRIQRKNLNRLLKLQREQAAA